MKNVEESKSPKSMVELDDINGRLPQLDKKSSKRDQNFIGFLSDPQASRSSQVCSDDE